MFASTDPRFYCRQVDRLRGVHLEVKHETRLRDVKIFFLEHMIPVDGLKRDLDSFYFTTRGILHATEVDDKDIERDKLADSHRWIKKQPPPILRPEADKALFDWWLDLE